MIFSIDWYRWNINWKFSYFNIPATVWAGIVSNRPKISLGFVETEKCIKTIWYVKRFFCVLIICSRLRVMFLSAFYSVLKGRNRTGTILENSLITALFWRALLEKQEKPVRKLREQLTMWKGWNSLTACVKKTLKGPRVQIFQKFS